MKHIYISAAIMLAAVGASAGQVENMALYEPDLQLLSVSPNGKWASGCDYTAGVVAIFNLETGEAIDIWNDTNVFQLAYNQSVTDDGAILVNALTINADGEETGSQVRVYNGTDYVVLPGAGFATAISGNGKYVVAQGSSATGRLWTLGDDGTWTGPETVQAPRVDVFGGTIQFNRPVGVSNDGKVVGFSTLTETGGALYSAGQPGVSIKGDDGKWTYWAISEKEIKSELERPEFPIFSPPSEALYCKTPEDGLAWLELNEKYQNGEISEWPDPVALGYMDEEGLAAWQAAYAAYVEEYNERDRKYLEEMSAYEEANRELGYFMPVSTVMSCDGRYIADTSIKSFPSETNPDEDILYNRIFVWDTLDGSCFTIDCNTSAHPQCQQVTSNADLLINGDVVNYVTNTYISTNRGPVQMIADWMSTRNETTYEWMETNMEHPENQVFQDGDPYNLMWFTGSLMASDNLNVLGGYIWNVMSYYEDPDTGMDHSSNVYINYVLNAASSAGISAPQVSAPAKGEAVYYDINGLRVANPVKGAFYVKVADGKASKVVF